MTDGDGLPEQYAPARPREASELTEVQVEICRRIMVGESVRSICRDDAMPAQSTVFDWLRLDPEFRSAYQLAKQLQAETLADEILEISDDGANDWMERKREDGSTEEVLNHEHVNRSRLRVDSRKWLAAKLAPKRYGDASTLRVDGGIGDDRRQMTQEEIAVRVAALMHAVNKRKGG